MDWALKRLGRIFSVASPSWTSPDDVVDSPPLKKAKLATSSSTPVPGNVVAALQNQVNDSLYELHRPEGVPTVQVLFFHGLPFGEFSEAYYTAWISGDGTCVWPKDWLAKEFPDAHILLVSYIEGLRQDSAESFDMRIIRENLINDLIEAKIGQTSHCPVVLVGHSFGGLVIKQLCLEAQNALIGTRSDKAMLKKLLDNLRGVFYYSTPHHGSPHIGRARSVLSGPLFRYFTTLSTEASRLNYDFDQLLKSYPKWQIGGLGEMLPVETGIFKGIVIVPEASTRGGEKFSLESADHFSVSRPENTTSRRFNALARLLSTICNNSKEEKAMALIRAIEQNFQNLPKDMIYMDGLLEDVKSQVKKFATLGFVGMGGLGKTTLAMAVFNELCRTYEYTCFVPDLKLRVGNVEEVKKVVWDYMHYLGKRIEVNCDWSPLIGKDILLVLDDIDSDRDITILSHLVDLFSPQSRFIVTSRDRTLLAGLEGIYKVPFLDQQNAQKLFISHAFSKQAIVPQNLKGDVVTIVDTCGGLPLTLEVIGRYLKSKEDGKFWKQTLQALENAESIQDIDKRLWAKLRISYDGLDEVVKQMFLDATTFFSKRKRKHDWRKHEDLSEYSLSLRDAKAAWRQTIGTKCEDLLWQTLVDRSLVYDVKENESIRVHDQLLSLGQKISLDCRKEGLCRVWRTETASKVLTAELKNEEIHALRLSYKRGIHISSHALQQLRKLQYLEVDGPLYIDGVQDYRSLPSKLVLLRCFGRLDAFDLSLQDRLVVLHLSGVKALPSSIGQLSALRIFKGKDLQRLPDEFGNLSQLEYLEFRECWLWSLPETFGRLWQLEYLEFSSCVYLQSLPQAFGKLSQLEYLKFKNCCLQILPETFGSLRSLKDLEIVGCRGFSLPRSFGSLSALNHLKLRLCQNISALPDSFGNLSALMHLEISACQQLEALPDSFGNLSALKHLQISYCNQLDSLPDSFGNLLALDYLKVERCQFEALPKSFGKLSTLRYMHLEVKDSRNCLSGIPFCQLTQLQYLKISGGSSLDQIMKLPESLVELTSLGHFVLDSVCIRSIPDFMKIMQSLHTLELSVLPYVKELPAWLGATGVAPLALSRKMFQVEDGRFSFISEEPVIRNTKQVIQRIHQNAMENLRKSDYEGALATLCPANLGVLEPKLQRFLLQERGIVKRFTGDLRGALADLTASLEVFSDADDGHEYMYDCWKHRGYVKFLLGDLDGAKYDGAMAFKLLPEYQYGAIVRSPSLGENSVAYMYFTLVRRRRKIDELWETMDLLHSQVMDKVGVSDLCGAPEGWDVIDAGRYGPNLRVLFLQERGILKRLAGDLHGALDDLTAALKICGEEKDPVDVTRESVKEEDLEDFDRRQAKAVAYNCWKHRGFVKFLLNDLDGAQKDGSSASILLTCRFKTFCQIPISPSLGEELVTYMQFKLHSIRDFDEVKSSQLQLHSQVMELVKMSDFSGALTIWKDFDAKLSGHFDRIFFMQESGVLKRLAGDLQGALDDLTAALKILSGGGDNCCKSCCPQRYLYICHMQRGYVNFLLEDVGGVQDDWANALKLLCKLLSDKRSMYRDYSPSFGGEATTSMDFRPLGKREIDGQDELLWPVYSRVMERATMSDFLGALAIWCAFDASVFGYYDRVFFLRERGVLKRMAGDLHGALKDLTAALEITCDDYECSKHRGYVKFLLGDIYGARKDAETCLAMGLKEAEHHFLGGFRVAFLEFEL